jgi:hypothetical protein
MRHGLGTLIVMEYWYVSKRRQRRDGRQDTGVLIKGELPSLLMETEI